MRTSCCGNWICNDHDKYVLFSYARNSCARNHQRYTLCSYHFGEGHKGNWKDCKECAQSFGTEIYVWFGTNEYNFEVLENPPHYEPTHCDRCGVVIKLGTDGYSTGPKGTLCERCGDLERSRPEPERQTRRPSPRKSKPLLPGNADPDAIEVIISAQVQKRWRIQPALSANERPDNWLAQWRLDFGRKADRTEVALMTNVATLYTFVFPLKELDRGRNLENLFRMRLGFALHDARLLARWQKAPIVFVAGNPRQVIGSMNDMRRLIAAESSMADGRIDSDEDFINRTPFQWLEESPQEEFSRRLANARPK
jgi:hypothetical protein